jgi:hypothetical protein
VGWVSESGCRAPETLNDLIAGRPKGDAFNGRPNNSISEIAP